MTWPALPKRVHQSLQLLCGLAKARRVLKARELAQLEEVLPTEAEKILQHLAWAGFLETRRGAKGGYWLALPAREIHIRDVLASFEPRVRTRSVRQSHVAKAMTQITEPARRAFERLTIADISNFGSRRSRRKGGYR